MIVAPFYRHFFVDMALECSVNSIVFCVAKKTGIKVITRTVGRDLPFKVKYRFVGFDVKIAGYFLVRRDGF